MHLIAFDESLSRLKPVEQTWREKTVRVKN